VAEDPIESSDVIVVPEWTGDAGTLEAADLVRRGFATRVAVLVKPREPSTRELIRRGILAKTTESGPLDSSGRWELKPTRSSE
jgi:hypothetical protein